MLYIRYRNTRYTTNLLRVGVGIQCRLAAAPAFKRAENIQVNGLNKLFLIIK